MEGTVQNENRLVGTLSSGGSLCGGIGTVFGKDGEEGKSAYEVAVEQGYEGTEAEWIESLRGQKGDAFTYSDFTAEQLAALKGEKGDKGDKGEKGNSGVYLGSGDMPADCNVQIDPSGLVNTLPADGANAIKGKKGPHTQIALDDVTPFEHELKIEMAGNTTDKIFKCGANLLDIENRKVVSFGNASNTTQRKFTGNGIIKGFAYNNYYTPQNVVSFEKHKNGFSFSNKVKQTYYGIGFDFKAVPFQTYYVYFEGMENISDRTFLFLSEYDADGNFLQYQFPKTAADGKSKYFTTTENTAWVIISIQNKEAEKMISYSNVYVGFCASTEFEEYREPEVYPVEADGTVKGVTSLYPTTTLYTDKPGALIMVEYNRDTTKVIEQLTNAIISLGGNI